MNNANTTYQQRVFIRAGLLVSPIESGIDSEERIQRRKTALEHLADTPPRPIDDVEPHAFPQRYIEGGWAMDDAGCDFDRVSTDYNGRERSLDLATSSNLNLNLCALLRSRT